MHLSRPGLHDTIFKVPKSSFLTVLWSHTHMSFLMFSSCLIDPILIASVMDQQFTGTSLLTYCLFFSNHLQCSTRYVGPKVQTQQRQLRWVAVEGNYSQKMGNGLVSYTIRRAAACVMRKIMPLDMVFPLWQPYA